MIISKPPNKVYDEQWERIYGRKHREDKDRATGGNENAYQSNTGANLLGEQPNTGTVPSETDT